MHTTEIEESSYPIDCTPIKSHEDLLVLDGESFHAAVSEIAIVSTRFIIAVFIVSRGIERKK